MTKFVVKKPSTQEIFDRHEGPYSLLVVRRGRDGELHSRAARKLLVTRQSVEREIRGWFEEEGVVSISVWSEACKYYITTYGETDVPAEDPGTDTKVIQSRGHVQKPE